ncbi:MAG: hypothetical protein IJU16_02675 [Clostridia bacterium]|nr:hypothetical protein [Clostridia bacterium]
MNWRTMGCISDPNTARLLARVEDAVCRADELAIPTFIGFLSEEETAEILQVLPRLCSGHDVVWRFFGGATAAQRVVWGVADSEHLLSNEDFPILPLAIRYRRQATISHRDILGSLLGCGLRREAIGDIICGDGFAVVYVHRELAPYIADTLDRVGREGVSVEWPYVGELPCRVSFRPIVGTVASPRLDAVLKVLLSCSREQAADLVKAGLVQVDHRLQLSGSMPLKPGHILSIRGKGKFIIDECSQSTKKGRLVLKARQYI